MEKFKSGALVWAQGNNPTVNLLGRRAAVVKGAVGIIGRYFWKLEGDYFVELKGHPCPNQRNGVPVGTWLAWARELVPRRADEKEEEPVQPRPVVKESISYRVDIPKMISSSRFERKWSKA